MAYFCTVFTPVLKRNIRDLPWLSKPAPCHSLLPYLALIFFLPLTSPESYMLIHSFIHSSILPLDCKLQEIRALICSVHCSVFCAWHMVGGQYLLEERGPNRLPLLSVTPCAAHPRWAALTVPHHPSVLLPPQILFIFQDPTQIPPFLSESFSQAVACCT